MITAILSVVEIRRRFNISTRRNVADRSIQSLAERISAAFAAGQT